MRATGPDRSALRLDAVLGRAPATPPILEPAAAPRRRVVWLAAGVVCAAISGMAWLGRPHDITPARLTTAPAPLGSASASSSSQSDSVVVDVEGDVLHPGLVTLPLGSRVADAIEAAGGFTRQVPAGQVNLAARLDDGQQIVIGAQAAGSTDKRVSLNTATAEQFDTLPGVGPVLAARIVAWRTAHHRFTAVDELAEVPGIGTKVMADLKPLVRL